MKSYLLLLPYLLSSVFCIAQNSPFGQVALGANFGDNFYYNGNSVGFYSLGWYFDQASQQIPPSLYLAGFQGMKFLLKVPLRCR